MNFNSSIPENTVYIWESLLSPHYGMQNVQPNSHFDIFPCKFALGKWQRCLFTAFGGRRSVSHTSLSPIAKMPTHFYVMFPLCYFVVVVVMELSLADNWNISIQICAPFSTSDPLVLMSSRSLTFRAHNRIVLWRFSHPLATLATVCAGFWWIFNTIAIIYFETTKVFISSKHFCRFSVIL